MKKIYSILLFSFIPFFAMGILAARYYVRREMVTKVADTNIQKRNEENQQLTILLIQADDLTLGSPRLAEIDIMFVLAGKTPSVNFLQVYPSDDQDIDLLLVSQFILDAESTIDDGFFETLRMAYNFSWDGTVVFDQTISGEILTWAEGILPSDPINSQISFTLDNSSNSSIVNEICVIASSAFPLDLSQFPIAKLSHSKYLLIGDKVTFEKLTELITTSGNIYDCEVLPSG